MNGRLEHGSFHDFFEGWLVEQSRHLDELVAVTRNGRTGPGDTTGAIRNLVDRVTHHYEHYYTVKSRFAEKDITAMFKPTWLSNLENAFTWIGGWRPSTACQLLYSKSSQQFESRLADVIRGLEIGDLADLSPEQMERVDALQIETVKEERRINEKVAKHQEKIANGEMVELSNLVSKAIRGCGEAVVENGRVEGALAPKKEGLVELLHMADELRIGTLKKMLQILSPSQGVYFLIAAAELHLRVHEWGKQLDSAENHH